jgi:hypothetical protein
MIRSVNTVSCIYLNLTLMIIFRIKPVALRAYPWQQLFRAQQPIKAC